MDQLLKKAYEIYGLGRTEYSKITGVPYKTLEGWEKNGLSNLGKLLIEAHITIKEKDIELQQKLEEYEDKAKRFDMIKDALKDI